MAEKTAQPDQERGLAVYPPGDATPGGVPAKRRAPQLRTAHDVCDAQAQLYRMAYRGEIPLEDATKLCYILNSLRESFKVIDLEYLIWLFNERLEEAISTGKTEKADEHYMKDDKLKRYLGGMKKRLSKFKLSR